MQTEDFARALDEWIATFRAEAIRQYEAGCVVTDVLKIAMTVADSKQNKRAMDRGAVSIPFDRLPPSPRRAS